MNRCEKQDTRGGHQACLSHAIEAAGVDPSSKLCMGHQHPVVCCKFGHASNVPKWANSMSLSIWVVIDSIVCAYTSYSTTSHGHRNTQHPHTAVLTTPTSPHGPCKSLLFALQSCCLAHMPGPPGKLPRHPCACSNSMADTHAKSACNPARQSNLLVKLCSWASTATLSPLVRLPSACNLTSQSLHAIRVDICTGIP